MNEKEKIFSMDAKITEKSVDDGSRVKKRHFTVLDFGLIVILVLAVLGIGFRTVIADWIMKSAPTETVSVSFKAEGISAEQLSHMKTGHVLSHDGSELGKLSSFSFDKSKAVIEEKDADGKVIFTTVEDGESITVTGTLDVIGRYTDRGFVCQDDLNLYVGKILNIQTNSYSITVVITEIPRK